MGKNIDRSRENNYGFLPTSAKEVKLLGWEWIDVILFTGDAYVDHPSFGTAVIARHLEAVGYRVAIVAQPSIHDDLRDFKKLGKPRLFFGVNAGNMDSMVNHYTASRRLRSDDAYTAGGRAGARPDYATVRYTKILKELYPDSAVVIGGIEASLRRLTHYDYWQDKLLPSILVDSGADVLMYGMGDKSIGDVANAMSKGFDIEKIKQLRQVAYLSPDIPSEDYFSQGSITLSSFEECVNSKNSFGKNFTIIERESNKISSMRIIEPCGENYVVVNPPYPPLKGGELDNTYSLPFTYEPHHRYRGKGAISAFEMIKFSVNIHRGCYGGCSFCTISAHQGKHITSRSESSILQELEYIGSRSDFRGVISDLGGPSANMWQMEGKDMSLCEKCARHSCLYPKLCPNMDNSHLPLIKLYDKAQKVDGIKKIFISSGIRYDLFDKIHGKDYLCCVVEKHTSGRFKVAPEHTSDRVLKMMRKPSFKLFEELCVDFQQICKRKSLPYEIVPYFISAHPGCKLEDMKELHQKIKGLHFDLRQVQDFTPTPMTLSSVIFYTGVDPYSGEKVFVERDIEKKRDQKELFFVGRNSFSKRATKQKDSDKVAIRDDKKHIDRNKNNNRENNKKWQNKKHTRQRQPK